MKTEFTYIKSYLENFEVPTGTPISTVMRLAKTQYFDKAKATILGSTYNDVDCVSAFFDMLSDERCHARKYFSTGKKDLYLVCLTYISVAYVAEKSGENDLVLAADTVRIFAKDAYRDEMSFGDMPYEP